VNAHQLALQEERTATARHRALEKARRVKAKRKSEAERKAEQERRRAERHAEAERRQKERQEAAVRVPGALTVPVHERELAEQMAEAWTRRGFAVEVEQVSPRKFVVVEAA
jgi:hypothetical protein